MIHSLVDVRDDVNIIHHDFTGCHVSRALVNDLSEKASTWWKLEKVMGNKLLLPTSWWSSASYTFLYRSTLNSQLHFTRAEIQSGFAISNVDGDVLDLPWVFRFQLTTGLKLKCCLFRQCFSTMLLEAHKGCFSFCIIMHPSLQDHHPLVFNSTTQQGKYKECISFPGGVLHIDDSSDGYLKSQKSLRHYDHRSQAYFFFYFFFFLFWESVNLYS